MKTKFRTKIKVNDQDIDVMIDYKTEEIKFLKTGSTYHFTNDEKLSVQKGVKKVLKQVAEQKFKR